MESERKKARLFKHGINRKDMDIRKAQALIQDMGDDRKCLLCNFNGNTENFVTINCKTTTHDSIANLFLSKDQKKKPAFISRASIGNCLDRGCPFCCNCANCTLRVTSYTDNCCEDESCGSRGVCGFLPFETVYSQRSEGARKSEQGAGSGGDEFGFDLGMGDDDDVENGSEVVGGVNLEANGDRVMLATQMNYESVIFGQNQQIAGYEMRCIKNDAGSLSFVFPRAFLRTKGEVGWTAENRLTTNFSSAVSMKFNGEVESLIGYLHQFPDKPKPELVAACDCRCAEGRTGESNRALLEKVVTWPKKHPLSTSDEFDLVSKSVLCAPQEDRLGIPNEGQEMLDCVHTDILRSLLAKIDEGSSSSSTPSLALKPEPNIFSMKVFSEKILFDIQKKENPPFSEKYINDFKKAAGLADEIMVGGGSGGDGGDDDAVFNVPSIVKLGEGRVSKLDALLGVTTFSGFNSLCFFSKLEQSSRRKYICNRHFFDRCFCIRMAEAGGGYVEDDPSENSEDDEEAEEARLRRIPVTAEVMSRKPRPSRSSFPFDVGHRSIKEDRKEHNLGLVEKLIPIAGCTCAKENVCPFRRVPLPICLCSLHCTCGAPWTTANEDADLVLLKEGAIIFSETQSFTGIEVYERKCVREGCAEPRLQFDGIEMGLTIFNRRKSRTTGEYLYVVFDNMFLYAITTGIEASNRTYEDFYTQFVENVDPERDGIVHQFIPSKTLFILMQQHYLEHLVLKYIPEVLHVCTKCGNCPRAIGGDVVILGVLNSIAGAELAAAKKEQEPKPESRLFCKVCIPINELQLFGESLGRLLRQMSSNNVSQKAQAPKPFTLNHFHDLSIAANDESTDESRAARHIYREVRWKAQARLPRIGNDDSAALGPEDANLNAIIAVAFAPSIARVLSGKGIEASFAYLAAGCGINILLLKLPYFVTNLPSAVDLGHLEANRVYNRQPRVAALADAVAFEDKVKDGLDNYFASWHLPRVGEVFRTNKNPERLARSIISKTIDAVREHVINNLGSPEMRAAFDADGGVLESDIIASSVLDKVCPPLVSYVREDCHTLASFNILPDFLRPLLACIGKLGINLWLRPEIYVKFPDPISGVVEITLSYEEKKENQITLTDIAARTEQMRGRLNQSWYLRYQDELGHIIRTTSRSTVSFQHDLQRGYYAVPTLRSQLDAIPLYTYNFRKKKEGGAAGHDPGDTLKGEKCDKEFPPGHIWTPGLMVLVCLCEKSCIYAVQILHSPESPKTFFDLVRNRFPVAPKFLVYDFACRLHTYCFRREPMYWWNTTFLIDRFHASNHFACAMLYQFKPWYDKRQETAKFITTSMETRNARLRSRLQKSFTCMNLHNAVCYLAMFIVQMNNPRITQKFSSRASRRA